MSLSTGSPNDKKVADFDVLSPEMRESLDAAEEAWIGSWNNNEGRTVREALQFFHHVPPLRCGNPRTATKTVSEKEKKLTPLEYIISEPDWVDKMVTARQPSFDMTVESTAHVRGIWRVMAAHSRHAPYRNTEEMREGETDDFHLHAILRPAAAIATAIRKETLITYFIQHEQGTTSDLGVGRTKDKQYIMAEDKRSPVFTKHQEKFCGYAAPGPGKKFPWPPETEMDKAEPALWGQFSQYRVNYVKLFSPAGVLYVRRKNVTSNTLVLSRKYDDLDGDVERTVCIILAACEQEEQLSTMALHAMVRCQDWISTWILSFLLWILWYRQTRGVYILFGQYDVFFRDVSEQFDVSSTISTHSFTKQLGRGASGVVVSSANGSEIVKLFSNEDLAQHEVNVLQRARGLAVPDLRGVVSDRKKTGVIMSYRGSPIRDVGQATTEQKQQLAAVLRSLHHRGIHHHDVHEDNILVDERGRITLVDFDRAELDVRCMDCADMAMLESLESL
ncbi:hypothetical protein DFH08DRAFT_816095 [Mycena albidolilacea]|uniref:Protein kinase domain-containing protein n=1 Tax=Mycena albidolilacea TaxID=1033008 RepID=A0AAD6ZKV4_9AGAR|nr:hypothetical protein DFH08DRAFT_816095 [Mycena albidolilacea]